MAANSSAAAEAVEGDGACEEDAAAGMEVDASWLDTVSSAGKVDTGEEKDVVG